MSGSIRILIVGGYGNFGGRLAQVLSREAGLTLLIAGRSQEKAKAFCAGLAGPATLEAVSFDRQGAIADRLRALRPQILIDATGPFQIYGDDPYALVKACIAHGIHYLDLADSADFVTGIAAYQDDALRAGVFAVSGLSTFPAVSFAALDALSVGMATVDTVTGLVAPSPRAGIGPNVIRAIASYAGKPVPLVRDGQLCTGVGLTETQRWTIAPPGHVPLENRRFALVEVPDQPILARRYPHLKTAWAGAGTAPQLLQSALMVMAWLVKWRVLPSLLPLAPLFSKAKALFQFGEHRGGMLMIAGGQDAAGERVEKSWHLLAEGEAGPFIPVLPAAAVIRRFLAGQPLPPGACPAAGLLSLADLDPLFAERGIVTGFSQRTAGDAQRPLYERILGEAVSALPPAVARMHESTLTRTVSGRAKVERGTGVLARLLAPIFRFPKASDDVPVSVTFTCDGGREVWTRNFAGRNFRSVQSAATGVDAHLLAEDFGPIRVLIALVVDGDKLRLVIRDWRLFGIGLPRFLMPSGDVFETEQDGRFRFHVEIASPLTGLIVRYRGWLA